MQIQANNYNVFFGSDYYATLSQFINDKKYSKIVVLVDTNTSQLCLNYFLNWLAIDVSFEIIEIEEGEFNKTIETCVGVWESLVELKIDRNALLINLGGGMVCDLGGFVASTYKRGIPFINVPTSLLAMVDASIGSKNGVDLGGLKNMVGTFSEPEMVLIDPTFLETLPAQQMRSGLSEMYKHGLIADLSYWQQLKNLNDLTTDDLALLIYHSVSIKNEIVLKDPFENNHRKLLNFGHTLGHVIETYSLSGKGLSPLLHGEAIAIGMILESYLSFKKGFLTENSYLEIKETLNLMFEAIVFTKNDIELCQSLLIHDKKNSNGVVNFTLLNNIGEGIVDQSIESQWIEEAFLDYLK